jgi:hypothetical protein
MLMESMSGLSQRRETERGALAVLADLVARVRTGPLPSA